MTESDLSNFFEPLLCSISESSNISHFESRPLAVITTVKEKNASQDTAQTSENATVALPPTSTSHSTFPPIDSAANKPGFVTIVDVKSPEDMFHKPEHGEDVEREPQEEETEKPDPITHRDHSYSLSFSVRGRPLRRSKACGDCEGCKRLNCNKCRFCMDKPKNGGPNRLKKRCIFRICTNMVPGGVGARVGSQSYSLSSPGEDIPEAESNENPLSPQEEEKKEGTPTKRTAIVTVDDLSPTERPKRQKTLPKKFSFDTAELRRNMRGKRGISKAKSESVIRTLRRRPFTGEDTFDVLRNVSENGGHSKLAKLRKQLLIDMAAPGTTLRKRRTSSMENKRIHVRSPPPYEGIPAAGTLTPVPKPVSSAKLSTTPTADQSGSEGLDVLASGAAELSKLPSVSTSTNLKRVGQGTAQNPNGREPIDPRLRLPRAVMSVDTQSPTQIRKHGPHIPRKKHMKNPKKKAEIALHAMKYGVASTIRHYFKEEGLDLKESTIRGWKKACFSNSSPQVERTLASDNSSENENLPSNESAKSPSKMGLPDNPAVWSPSHVQQYVAGCGFPEVAAQLMEEEVDGEAMLELTPIALVQCLKIKLGPAIKVCKCFEQPRIKAEASKINP